MSELNFIAREREREREREITARRNHPGFDNAAGSELWNRERVWCRGCATYHQRSSHCPLIVRAKHGL